MGCLENIFANDFESGELSAWGGADTGRGALSVGAEAALQGSYGLRAQASNGAEISVWDGRPLNESRHRVCFAFDPNSLSLPGYQLHRPRFHQRRRLLR